MYTCTHLPRERGRGSLELRVQDIGLTRAYLEVHGTYNLLSNCSYNPTISRVTVVMGLIFGL